MFVGLRMSRTIPVCAPDDGLDKAIQVMREKKVRQLFVTEGDRVVGVLSRIDLQHVLPSTATTLAVNEMNYQLSRLKVARLHDPHGGLRVRRTRRSRRRRA